MIQGYVDLVDTECVQGWAFDDESESRALRINVFEGDRYLGSVPANMAGDDLSELGFPSCRFRFRHPQRLEAAALPSIRVCVEGEHDSLSGGYEQTVAYLRHEIVVPELLQPYHACSDATVEDRAKEQRVLRFEGDLFVDPSRFSDVRITVEGTADVKSVFDLPTHGRAAEFWFLPDATRLGFSVEASILGPNIELAVARLEFTDVASGEQQKIPLVAVPAGKSLRDVTRAMPDGDMIRRVIGTAGNVQFEYVVSGWSNAVHLNWLAEKYAGKGVNQMAAILDWGCGCARNTVPIKMLAGSAVAVSGYDVDPKSIAWARDNIPGIEFRTVDYLPPMDAADGSFDLVYGLSVFTHLTELAQDLWLEELARVMKPGGIAALTFHGEASAYSRPFSASAFHEYRMRGIEDYVLDTALVGVGDDVNYYRSTFHTTDYIRKRWGKVFDIRGIEVAMGGHQWIAVCQKRR